MQGWRKIIAEEGVRGVFFGWSPTFVGYSFQGAGKYGAYEVFKYYYGEKLFPNTNKTLVYLGASATAEAIADVFLCPFEAIKIRMQTTLPPYAHTLREGWSKVVAEEGFGGLYKGLYPLWARQIPYTMVKFSSFEAAVSKIYEYLGKPKDSYGPLAQTGVSFLGGYIAGIGCATVSHPADVMVSKLNSGRKAGEGAGAALARIYGDIGFMGLWNGLPTRIVMIGTLTAFQWLIYDSFKVYLGVSVLVHSDEACSLTFYSAPNHRWSLNVDLDLLKSEEMKQVDNCLYVAITDSGRLEHEPVCLGHLYFNVFMKDKAMYRFDHSPHSVHCLLGRCQPTRHPFPASVSPQPSRLGCLVDYHSFRLFIVNDTPICQPDCYANQHTKS